MAVTRDFAHSAHQSSAFEAFTRIGFAAKGVVYLLIGVLALMAAFGEGGQTTGSKGAVAQLAQGGFGQIALIIMGIGLAGYALWRIVGSINDAESHGSDAKGMATRIVHFGAGVAYGGTAFFALNLAFGNGGGGAASGGGGQNSQAESFTAVLLQTPMGVLLVVAIGIAVVIGGLFQIRHGLKEKFLRNLRALPPTNNWVTNLGKAGYIARGIVFGIIGGFVVVAALRHDSSKVRGMEGALDTLARQPYGQILLAAVAAGLACYGLYCLAAARYRKL